MQYLDIRQIKGHVQDDEAVIKIKAGDVTQRISLAYQKAGFGKKRFFRCPRCSKRVERIYFIDDRWRCAKCSGVNPYGGIQNKTKGGYDEIGYRMNRYAEKHNIQFDFPFDYTKFINDKRNKRESFRKHIRVLQSLENMRTHAIFFNATYKPYVCRLVTSGKHPLMQSKTLQELSRYIYDWSVNADTQKKKEGD